MTCEYSSGPRIEKNIIDFRACAEMREASTSLLKFLHVLNPNKPVIRKFFKDLIGCLHDSFDPRDLFFISQHILFNLPARRKKLHTLFPVGLAGSCIKKARSGIYVCLDNCGLPSTDSNVVAGSACSMLRSRM